MDSRVNRYYKKKSKRKNKRIKIFLAFLVFLILFSGLSVVNNCYNFSTEVENKDIFNYKYLNGLHDIELMGRKYKVSQTKINSRVSEDIVKLKNKVTHMLDNLDVFLNN